ncbi:hypothetical protein ACFVFN_21855, partial [Streptomyces pharetrae]
MPRTPAPAHTPARAVRTHAPIRTAVAAALLAPLAACSANSGPAGTADTGRAGKDGGDRPVTVTVTPTGRQASAGKPVEVTAAGGSLTSVTVTDAEG